MNTLYIHLRSQPSTIPDEPALDKPVIDEPALDELVIDLEDPAYEETTTHTPGVGKDSGGQKRDAGELDEENQGKHRSKRIKCVPGATDEDHAGRRTSTRASSNAENVPVTADKGKRRKDSKGKVKGKSAAQSISTSAGQVLQSRATSDAGSAVSGRATGGQRGRRDVCMKK
ncbi:hypothetical protein OH76DRAFT_1415744 [Lentinus brumalis]|uniref:Uncharacterized protein n=1 Tax=Lentinus brumalis TaxID=2498619 RepID=A0A371DPG1_9APHY|nr:hypothetical protein OH76DRAFT_1415744 [Polyporus brumalis]